MDTPTSLPHQLVRHSLRLAPGSPGRIQNHLLQSHHPTWLRRRPFCRAPRLQSSQSSCTFPGRAGAVGVAPHRTRSICGDGKSGRQRWRIWGAGSGLIKHQGNTCVQPSTPADPAWPACSLSPLPSGRPSDTRFLCSSDSLPGICPCWSLWLDALPDTLCPPPLLPSWFASVLVSMQMSPLQEVFPPPLLAGWIPPLGPTNACCVPRYDLDLPTGL